MSAVKNILLVTADELRSDCVGFMGNREVRTPHLDGLAARGTVCENHFTSFPKCVPARCSMQTGRYTHTDGLRTVMAENHLPEGTPTLAGFLREQGYETAVFGLNHVWENEWFYGTGDQKNQKGAGVVDYTSFTEGPIRQLAMQDRIYPDGTPASGPHIDALAEIDYQGLISGKVERKFADENRTDQAILYLRELRDRSRPFFLQLNLSNPHPPYGIHEPYFSMYDRETLTPFPVDLPENATLCLRAMRKWRLGDDIPEGSLRELLACYYGETTFIDDQIGRLMEAFDAEDLARETLVIFTSDHGDFAGQYGLNEKWDASLQDCLLKVPFLLAGPGIPAGERTPCLTEHVDLPATLLELLGLAPPEEWTWHGTSLLPTLTGTATKQAVFADGGHEAAMRDRFDAEAWQEKNGRRVKTTGGKQLTYQQCPDAMARCKMIRTQEWKLVIRETGGNELFHLPSDPCEMQNRYGEPGLESLTSQLLLQLVEWTLRTDPDRPFLPKFGA